MPVNFMRHYYDVYCLLGAKDVQSFIGTDDYFAHKQKRFRNDDVADLSRNDAFLLKDGTTRRAYASAYAATRALYYREQVPFEAILERIAGVVADL